MSNITLVVVNWNQQRVIELCLKSYVRHHYKGEPLNLILWDNGSQDNSKQWLWENGIPFFNCEENLGHEQALNRIWPNVGTKYMLLVDSDVEFTGDVHTYLQFMDDKCKIVGDLITGDQLHSPVKPRIGAWFSLLDAQAMKEKGVEKYRDSEDWSLDVNGYMTHKVFEHGFTHHQIDRAPGHIDYDVIGMKYPLYNHLGKVSWNLNNHGDRRDEVAMRLRYVEEKLKEYSDIDLKNKYFVM
jgi:glycosyltransferase involved in cell wall biosynthesis